MCQEKGKNDEPFRVTKETYQTLQKGYAHQFDCNQQNVTKDVCVCPKGHNGHLCAGLTPVKCYVRITNPDLSIGCSDRPDTAYYLYSIPGFSPCYFFDFSAGQYSPAIPEYPLGFRLECRDIAPNGNMAAIDPKEHTGYEYRDVVEHPQHNEFKYASQNPKTHYAVGPGNYTDPIDLQIEFFDMKYLSQTIVFKQTITDVDILTGVKNGTLPLNFT